MANMCKLIVSLAICIFIVMDIHILIMMTSLDKYIRFDSCQKKCSCTKRFLGMPSYGRKQNKDRDGEFLSASHFNSSPLHTISHLLFHFPMRMLPDSLGPHYQLHSPGPAASKSRNTAMVSIAFIYSFPPSLSQFSPGFFKHCSTWFGL